MDIVLLSSSVEGVPNVAIEAQAAGLPVVVPDVGGTSEGLLDNVTGIVARPRSPASLASAVLNLIDNPAWRRAVQRDGPIFVASRFGFDRMVVETAHLYATGQETLPTTAGQHCERIHRESRATDGI
jgi:glycosyltransferase involved in cell wall biosynthesis